MAGSATADAAGAGHTAGMVRLPVRTILVVLATIVSMWLLAGVIHRLATLVTYVVVLAVGYALGRLTDGDW